jgi:sulfur relay (sulfurtransferase) complex TusBCD TusD component (DsrE family)
LVTFTPSELCSRCALSRGVKNTNKGEEEEEHTYLVFYGD